MFEEIKCYDLFIQFGPQQYAQYYGDDFICVESFQSLSSHSCGIYIKKSVTSLCLRQETYVINGSNRYSLHLDGM